MPPVSVVDSAQPASQTHTEESKKLQFMSAALSQAWPPDEERVADKQLRDVFDWIAERSAEQVQAERHRKHN